MPHSSSGLMPALAAWSSIACCTVRSPGIPPTAMTRARLPPSAPALIGETRVSPIVLASNWSCRSLIRRAAASTTTAVPIIPMSRDCAAKRSRNSTLALSTAPLGAGIRPVMLTSTLLPARRTPCGMPRAPRSTCGRRRGTALPNGRAGVPRGRSPRGTPGRTYRRASPRHRPLDDAVLALARRVGTVDRGDPLLRVELLAEAHRVLVLDPREGALGELARELELHRVRVRVRGDGFGEPGVARNVHEKSLEPLSKLGNYFFPPAISWVSAMLQCRGDLSAYCSRSLAIS